MPKASEEYGADRSNFEEEYCNYNDALSTFEYEDNIHGLIVDGLHTITIPIYLKYGFQALTYRISLRDSKLYQKYINQCIMM
eukprot:7566074-Ditylum_brightwellii.AAC.1